MWIFRYTREATITAWYYTILDKTVVAQRAVDSAVHFDFLTVASVTIYMFQSRGENLYSFEWTTLRDRAENWFRTAIVV